MNMKPNGKSQLSPSSRHLAWRFPASIFLSCLASAIFAGHHAAAEPGTSAPRAPRNIIPNASRVTAAVLSRKVWPPGSLENVRPLVPATKTFWSVELKIDSSELALESPASLLETGRTIDAFSDHPIPAEIVGKKIKATVTLIGGTEGVRWMIKKFDPLPDLLTPKK